MNSTKFFIYFFVIAHCYLTSTVHCDCCYSFNYVNCPGVGGSATDKCADCSDDTPYCGYGKCNIFGCACAGGCRSGACSDCQQARRRKRDTEVSAPPANGTDILKQADKDQDGKLSVDEAVDFLYVMKISASEDLIREGIVALDQDKDGFLMHSEIDP